MNKAYERINWENYPSENTALNEANLNKMDAALNEVDNRVVVHETTKLDVATANSMVKNVSFNERSGIFTVTYLNGSTKELDTKLEKIATNFVYDEELQKLILTLIDGTTQEIDMSALITQYEFENSAYIKWTVVNGKVKAEIINGSITADKLQPNFLADVTLQANRAKTSEQNAKVSEENAKQSEINAKNYADSAEPVASTAQGLNPTLENSTNAPFITFKGKGATIQDGEPAPDNPVDIVGVGESGVLEVKSTGKNLFDVGSYPLILNRFLDITDGGISISTSNNWYGTLDYIPFEYTGEITKSSGVDICFYDENKNFIATYTTATKTFVIPIGTKYIRLDVHKDYKDVVQIELGDTATPYEPYTETKADIPLSAPMYEDDYIRYNMDGTGELVRKMASVVFNGSESGWLKSQLANTNMYYIAIPDAKYAETDQNSSNVKGCCTHFNMVDSYHQSGQVVGFGSCGFGVISALHQTMIGFNVTFTMDEWKAWLAKNPITVVYELAEPTVTPLTAEQIAEFEKLQTFDGVTHVTCDGETEISYFADSVGGKAVAQLDKVLNDAISGVESNKSLINDVNNLLNDAICKRVIREELTLTVGANLSATWEKDLSEDLLSGYALMGVVGYDITYKNLALNQVRTGGNANGGVSLYCTFSNSTNESKTISTSAEFDLLLVKAELA